LVAAGRLRWVPPTAANNVRKDNGQALDRESSQVVLMMPGIELIVDRKRSIMTGEKILAHAVPVPEGVKRFEGQVAVFLNELLSEFGTTAGVRCVSPRGESYAFTWSQLPGFALLSTNTPSWKLVPAGRNQLQEITVPRFVLREVAVIEMGPHADSESPADQVYTNLTDALMNPAAARFVNLTSAHLEAFPMGLLDLVNLESLNLGNNRIHDIPPEIGDLRNLKVLKLSRNQLRTLPEEIGRLKRLSELHVSRNQIDTLPEKLWNLDQLEIINLGNNRLTSLPDGIVQLKSLREMELSDNPFSKEERQRIQERIPHVQIEW
jgi:hypothetical protein